MAENPTSETQEPAMELSPLVGQTIVFRNSIGQTTATRVDGIMVDPVSGLHIQTPMGKLSGWALKSSVMVRTPSGEFVQLGELMEPMD